jgi:hypothetical protein
MPKVYVAHGGNTKNMGSLKAEHCDRVVEEAYNTYFKGVGYTLKAAYSMISPKGGAPEDVKYCNEGAHFMNYDGHGATDGWSFGWKTGNLSQLTNTIYPNIVSCCCNSGDWDQSSCFTVNYVAAQKAATTAIGGYGISYNGMHSVNKGVFDAIMKKNMTKIGLAWVNGLNTDEVYAAVAAAPPTSSEFNLTSWQYHLFGDPGAETMVGANDISTSAAAQKSKIGFTVRHVQKSVVLNFSVRHNAVLTIYSLSGKELFSTNIDVSTSTYTWNRQTNAKTLLSNGVFVATLKDGNAVSKIVLKL